MGVVAASRQRVDLTLFAVHHDLEWLEAALTRSWARSDGKRLALDLAHTDHLDSAMRAGNAELDRSLPERIGAWLACLHEKRESARQVALTESGDEAAGARQQAQLLTDKIQVLQAMIEWPPASLTRERGEADGYPRALARRPGSHRVR